MQLKQAMTKVLGPDEEDSEADVGEFADGEFEESKSSEFELEKTDLEKNKDAFLSWIEKVSHHIWVIGRSCSQLFVKEHPDLAENARLIWRELSASEKARPEWWTPTPVRSALQMSGLSDEMSFALLSDDLKADWIARALEDEKRFAEEQAMRMPSFVKAAIQAVEEKLKIKKQASKKTPRKESSGAIGPKVVLMASAAPPVKPQTGENGEKMTAKAQKEEKLKAFSEWVSKFHPGLLRSVSLEVKKKEKKGQFLFLFCFVLFCFFVFVFVCFFFFFFFQH